MANGAYIESSYRMPKRIRQLLWAGAVLLFVAGVVAVVVVFTRGSGEPAPAPTPSSLGAPAKQSGKAAPRSVKLDPAAKRVLGRFVLTAVAREHLDEAWTLAGPGLRQGMTRKQWLTGAIPVVPFPVHSLQYAPFKIDYSRPNHALVEVAMVPTDANAKKGVKSQIFFADLVRRHGKWFVDSWVPRGFPALPTDQNHG